MTYSPGEPLLYPLDDVCLGRLRDPVVVGVGIDVVGDVIVHPAQMSHERVGEWARNGGVHSALDDEDRRRGRGVSG